MYYKRNIIFNTLNGLIYEFLGEPDYVYDYKVRERAYSYIFYGYHNVDFYQLHKFCAWYSIKGRNVLCLGPDSRFATVMVFSDSFRYHKDTLISYRVDRMYPFQQLSLNLFYFCPPTSSCRVCIWEQGEESDSTCFLVPLGRNFLSASFYKPKEFRRWYFPWIDDRALTFVTYVELFDTLFKIKLSKFDTTTIILY